MAAGVGHRQEAAGPAPLDPAALPGPVWVVSPHPDDEALGCGALIAALCAQGREVRALLLTDGGASHPGSLTHPRPRLAAERRAEWRAGLAALGVPAGHTTALEFPDGALAGCPPATVAGQVRAAFALALPSTVLLPWRRDPHPDHRAAWEPVVAASPPGARRLGYTVWLAERGEGPDWPARDEARAWVFPTGRWAAAKARAVAAHATQLGAIRDDPGGFTLDPAMVRRAVAGPERFYEPWPDAPSPASFPGPPWPPTGAP